MPINPITPGVYVQEISSLGRSVVPVPTSIPAFIGFTEKVVYKEKDITLEPVYVDSFDEFKTIFGSAAEVSFVNTQNGLELQSVVYRLYGGVKWFYENGGGRCCILSVGVYDKTLKTLSNINPFEKALKKLEKESQPSILVIPDAIEFKIIPIGTNLPDAYGNCYKLQNEMINHCGRMMNRFAILDVPGGVPQEPLVDPIPAFRDNISPSSPQFLGYAAAYYPYLNTDVLESSDFSKEGSFIKLDKSSQGAILKEMNLMAPSAAMAGIYAQTDIDRGVWKAPANVTVANVTSPAVSISDVDQGPLNVSFDGKSICAIRAFYGRGIMVWGARTLDGNSNDWRYVPVRRTMIYIEQSVKYALEPFVFEPNDANTWTTIKSMVENFLMDLWRQGGLVGSTTSEAYAVKIGLGETMTQQDILNKIMRVQIAIALIHPAEFIIITLEGKSK
jgi:phage tail sheath protein FI